MPLSLTITLIVAVLAAVITLEVLSCTLNDKHVAFRCEVDMGLTEPDEVATLTYRVRNTAFWPIMFVGFSFLLNDGVEIREDEAWVERHSSGGLFGNMYSFETYLMPHRALKGKLHFSLKERGRHSIGRVYLEAGDLLGFKTKVFSFDIPGSVICTAKALEDDPQIVSLGGFLGDISVRRFIMEDPSLVLGYREYTGAEPMKNISWTQTAKTGCLMVKKHDFTVDIDIAVIVDIEFCDKPAAERCLSLVRTVCDRLEEARIPYALFSNGDLFEMQKGIGRQHNFEVQRRIGISKFVKYKSFDEVVLHSVRNGFGKRGFIVILPRMDRSGMERVARLESVSDSRACVLCGEVEKDA